MAYGSFLDRTKGLQYLVAFLYSLVVAVLWIPAFVIRRTYYFVRDVGTESWPQANGSITACDVKVIHGWVVDYAVGRLDYSYRVAGQYYAGSTTRQYPDEQAAWDFVDARRDKPIVMRYKDDNPPTSTVREADQEAAWIDGTGQSLFQMVSQHWRDELRGEQQVISGDDGLEVDEGKTNPVDPVGHRRD